MNSFSPNQQFRFTFFCKQKFKSSHENVLSPILHFPNSAFQLHRAAAAKFDFF